MNTQKTTHEYTPNWSSDGDNSTHEEPPLRRDSTSSGSSFELGVEVASKLPSKIRVYAKRDSCLSLL